MLTAASLLAAAPLLPGERAALSGYVLHVVASAADPHFDLAYDALAAYFGARGQLESRADLARLVAQVQAPADSAGVVVGRPLLLLLSPGGELAAVAERYVAYDRTSRVLSALDADLLVLPGHRGAGIGTALERLLIHAGRLLLAEHGADDCAAGLELGDLEPLPRVRAVAAALSGEAEHAAAETDALRRIAIWGQAGYALIPQAVFPLALLGMAATTGAAQPMPMLPILRVGMSQQRQRAEQVSKAQLRTLAHHLYAAHAWADGEAAAQALSLRLACIESTPCDPVALLPLPQRITDAIPDFLCLA